MNPKKSPKPTGAKAPDPPPCDWCSRVADPAVLVFDAVLCARCHSDLRDGRMSLEDISRAKGGRLPT